MWYDDPEEVLLFGRILHRTMLVKMEAYYDNPRAYDKEYNLWVEHGKPTPNNVDAWEDWTEKSFQVAA